MRCTGFIAAVVHIIGVAFVFAAEAPLQVLGRSLDGQMTLTRRSPRVKETTAATT
jgi:hypothetical protein